MLRDMTGTTLSQADSVFTQARVSVFGSALRRAFPELDIPGGRLSGGTHCGVSPPAGFRLFLKKKKKKRKKFSGFRGNVQKMMKFCQICVKIAIFSSNFAIVKLFFSENVMKICPDFAGMSRK